MTTNAVILVFAVLGFVGAPVLNAQKSQSTAVVVKPDDPVLVGAGRCCQL